MPLVPLAARTVSALLDFFMCAVTKLGQPSRLSTWQSYMETSSLTRSMSGSTANSANAYTKFCNVGTLSSAWNMPLSPSAGSAAASEPPSSAARMLCKFHRQACKHGRLHNTNSLMFETQELNLQNWYTSWLTLHHWLSNVSPNSQS